MLEKKTAIRICIFSFIYILFTTQLHYLKIEDATLSHIRHLVKGLLELEDAETGETVLLDTSSAGVRGAYSGLGGAESSRLKSLFRRMNVDMLELMTGEDYARSLLSFFRRRGR